MINFSDGDILDSQVVINHKGDKEIILTLDIQSLNEDGGDLIKVTKSELTKLLEILNREKK